MDHSKYCPFCCKHIHPYCDEDGDLVGSEHTGFLYIHDDVPHDKDYAFEELH